MDLCKKKFPFRRLSSNDLEPEKHLNKAEYDWNRSLAGHTCSECAGLPRFAMLRPTNRVTDGRSPTLSASNTHLSCLSFADSVSPRVSLDNLTLGEDQSDENPANGTKLATGKYSNKGQHLGSGDRLPSSATQQKQMPFLSPNPHHKMSPLISPRLVSRSTSCPSMAGGHKRTRSVSGMTSPTSPKNHQYCSAHAAYLRQYSANTTATANSTTKAVFDEEERDIVHEMNDTQRNRSIPKESAIGGSPNCGNMRQRDQKPDKSLSYERPMHTRRININKKEWRLADKTRKAIDDKPNVFSQSYINIGDIPSYLAERVISDRAAYKSDSGEAVKSKCLQWLNSLDSDED